MADEQPMNWRAAYRRDIERYLRYSGKSTLRKTVLVLLTEQGLWALLQYRLTHALHRSSVPWMIKKPLLLLALFWQKLVEVLTGICLPGRAVIGPGLYIGHFGPLVVHRDAVIGHRCNLSQGVTIGVSGRGERRGVPRIGDRVYIATNAVVVGKITVGDDAVIGANSVVREDVAPHTTVLGVPATVISQRGSEDYIDPGDR
jgi:serine O-acetyltransferase